jgi:neurofibromin 1
VNSDSLERKNMTVDLLIILIDIANFWRARWMSLVASTAFQFNPAVQPRAFVVLGCLGREEIDDDLLYQILVALRGALAIFNESDPSLVTSIMMCLKNVVGSLPSNSRYLLQLFWASVALIEINTGPTFGMAIELLQAVLRALDEGGFFSEDTVVDVLIAAREPIADVARQLDMLCGVNFDTHFSFAIAGIFMKGLRYNDAKDILSNGLNTFLDIECKQAHRSMTSEENNIIEAQTLGYVTALLPIAAKNESVKELLRMVGLNETDIEGTSHNGKPYSGIFDKLDIPEDTTALLLISMLATMLNAADSGLERLLIYGLLSDAAVAMPEVFALV